MLLYNLDTITESKFSATKIQNLKISSNFVYHHSKGEIRMSIISFFIIIPFPKELVLLAVDSILPILLLFFFICAIRNFVTMT